MHLKSVNNMIMYGYECMHAWNANWYRNINVYKIFVMFSNVVINSGNIED